MNTTDEVEIEVARFLARCNFGRPPEREQDIFKLGTVTSLVLMQTVLFIEKRWKIRLEPKQLNRDNFRTVAAIGVMVSVHLNTTAETGRL